VTVLTVDALSKSWGDVPAIARIDLAVEPGELLCLVGPSGCGKTTLLRCVAGLLPPTSGTVHLAGQRVTAPPRSMAVVFQDYSRSLLPWLDIHGNVTLPLKAQRVPRGTRQARADEALAAVGLEGHTHKYPWQLSGGMQQRAAIARALAYDPEVLLLDEPFASVDAQTRADLEDLLLSIWTRQRLTVLLVTHDIDEAVYLADRVVVLSPPPTRVAETVSVDLPRPRDQIATKALPRFAELRAHVLRTITHRRPDEAATHRTAPNQPGPDLEGSR
jgi:NitT/TauT family transport system ATP-binding protein